MSKRERERERELKAMKINRKRVRHTNRKKYEKEIMQEYTVHT